MIFILITNVALTYIFAGETNQDVPSQAPKKAAKVAPAVGVPPKTTTAEIPAVSPAERPKATAKSKQRPVEEEGMWLDSRPTVVGFNKIPGMMQMIPMGGATN